MPKTTKQLNYYSRMRKLTPEQREEARNLRQKGFTIDQLAAKYGVAHNTMFKVLHTKD